ncbi:hypothetical protein PAPPERLAPAPP_01970 [Brevundimonas phage vB_BpoS-Papperlapapp]|uniref:Uncharacterized protein n=1 Tax=Brevundimonas phage vB_BpoS-Kabachok TaxID=2948600 RepID=A0A9E7SLK1_9CAUD|nr:hypothetical protein KABACHOK_00350 [Brevundimonas phage vB_BpoS-Kabachok]USN15939.1 hypothetical protein PAPPERLAPAPP_01970 [Brevundimonas phage vB_BpoS-Papperlapapp]
MIRPRNLFLALKSQLPLKRLLRNFFITGNAWGLFSRHSHIAQGSGKPKVMYGSPESAQKAADSMQRKHGGEFRPYKCAFCDGYHIGKNRAQVSA